MKILIIHAEAGAGHTKAALALQKAFSMSDTVHEVRLVQALEYTSGLFRKWYPALYHFMISYLSSLWGVFYYLLDQPQMSFLLRPVRRLTNGLVSKNFIRYLKGENPDLIVCTHFFATEIVSYLKKKGELKAPLVTVITDFMPHQFWISDETDYYCVAFEETARDLIRRGISEEKIKITGIPVDPVFADSKNTLELKRKLGLEETLHTVLLTSGASTTNSFGDAVERILEIENPMQLIVVCGTNTKLYDRISRITTSGAVKMKVLRFVTNMDELMACADLVVGKGGGLTVSEALAKAKPIIIVNPIPGQEMRNTILLVSRNAGMWVKHPNKIVHHILLVFKMKGIVFKSMARSAAKMSRPQAAFDIMHLCQKLLPPH